MWSTSEEPPGTMEVEGESPEHTIQAKEKCEQNKSQLESLKEIMLKNKQSLKKKEEEVQEYARRLSKIKSRAKLSRRSKEGNVPAKDVTHSSEITLPDTSEETIDDISQAKTTKAKSTLLQKKLAENRKVFERRNKELTESKRAVEEKVEAIRQQLEEKDVAIINLQKEQLPVTPVKPVMVTSDIMSPIQIENIQEKEKKIAELNNKILELEATVMDLQENLKEKDSVIESKTRAVTLMSADLSMKGKTTLDTLEETKDEMRTMQENFVLLETSLKNKNESLLEQLQGRDNKIAQLEESINRFEQQVNEQKVSESASVDFSRSTMDNLIETKEAMKSMQENFVLIETSLKAKNDNLLQQLEDYELKVAEANERIFKLESGMGIVRDPSIDDLQFKLEKLEHNNKQLQDEKYELQKNVAELQDKIVNISVHGNGAVLEKDNRIAELENLIEELKQSNKLLEEESKTELQKQLADLTLKNEEYSNKVTDLENLVHELEAQNNNLAARIPDESAVKEDEKVAKLTKELEELNKTMIKIKAQHKSKIKGLQKELENFKMVSDANAELVRLGNQVALLEEEKGNLQLSLVDFDELKATAGDWQERVADLESKVSTQAKEIQMQIEAIATLENQKLDLVQELHVAKQEISALEAENAESENLRVTAEMKVVDLEEQLEAMHRLQNESKSEISSEANHAELIKRIEVLTQENSELYSRITKIEEKGVSDSGSTESFEAIQELDKNDLVKKIEELTQKNNEVTLQLSKYQEKENSHAGSTESFESINNSDTDKNELLKKIDQLTQENTDLTMKLSRVEEKGSSDTGSTESFERIPEHNETMTKIELLTRENHELVIKLTKVEEQLEYMEANRMESTSDVDLKTKINTLLEENSNQSSDLLNLKEQVTNLNEENSNLQKQIETLTVENNDLIVMHSKLKGDSSQVKETSISSERSKRDIDFKAQIDALMEEKDILEKQIKELRNALEQSSQDSEIIELKTRLEELSKENVQLHTRVSDLEVLNQELKEDLSNITQEKEEVHKRINEMLNDDPSNEELELIEKLEKLKQEKQSIAKEKQEIYEPISLLQKSNADAFEVHQMDEPVSEQKESMIVASLEHEIGECKKLISEQTGLIEEMKIKLANKEEELEEKGKQILEYEATGKKTESLENELKEMFNTIEEWKYKCNEMQEKMEKLEAGKASIEEGFKMLQSENEMLLEEKREKDAEANSLKQELQDTRTLFETKLQEQLIVVSTKEDEIANLKQSIEDKDQELHTKYAELQNTMITIDSLQDECSNCKMLLLEKDSSLTSMSDEVAHLNDAVKRKEEEIYSLKADIIQLNDKVQEFKPLEDYNELLDQLRDKNSIIDDIQCKINATTKENSNLLEKVKILSQQNNDIENQLAEKQQELVDLMKVKEHLDAQIIESKSDRSEAENQIWSLQSIIDNNAKFVEDLQAELRNGYRQIEQLKVKHMEDIELQNHRLESLIDELNAKSQECEALKNELQEKERLIGQNVTESTKVALEAKIADLEQKLKDSEDKTQMQLEKMKKIAANLKKKTAVCQELETRVAEIEEKWMTEKDEKEAKNKQIQDVEISMREKDNKIADLEEKLIQARDETAETFKRVDTLTNDLSRSNEKISLLTQQITEMEEEIVKLRVDIESLTTQLHVEKQAKENVLSDYESYKQQVTVENERKQLEMDEARESARELNVRMQVMEAEYVEQLALIKNLMAEIGLLQSKQAQINEKLETVEKESEERRILIEQMQREVVSTATEATQTSDEEVTEDDMKIAGVQHCSHCEQCQTLVQALEAKLQEREAEIENLDNELANSIGNFVQMRESLRLNDLMNQTSMRNRTLENPYNDLLLQYNVLTSSHEEIKIKLEEALKENKELAEKIEGLQSTNSTLEEKIVAVEQTLEETKQDAERLQHVDELNSSLVKKCEERETELLNMKQEMQIIQEHADQLEQQVNSQTVMLMSVEEQRIGAEKLLEDTKDSLEREIDVLKTAKNASQKMIEDLTMELEMYKNQSAESMEKSVTVKEEPTFDHLRDERDTAPHLFDASKIFGTPFASDFDVVNDKEIKRLQNLLDEKEAQCANLTQEINHLQALMLEEKSQMSQNYSQCAEELEESRKQLQTSQATLERLEQTIIEKDRLLNSLNAEFQNSTIQQSDMDNRLTHMMAGKDHEIEELRMSLNSTKEALGGIIAERDQQSALVDSYKLQITNLEAELKNLTDPELIQELENRISATTKERDLLQLQVNDLSRSVEEWKVESERNLQMEIEKVTRERDEAKEVVANLTRALEDAYKSSDKTPTITDSSTKESTPLEESATVQTHEELGASKTVCGDGQEAIALETEAWDIGSSEKLNIDEENWDWNAYDAQLVDEHQLTAALVPSTEMQLQAKVDDLEDRIKDLEKEKAKMLEENKAAQVSNGKMIKKLSQYKMQVESLRQQLKIQKSAGDFCKLDSAIEEEFKSQISKLEKTLREVKEEHKSTNSEKESLIKRLDVVVSANERYMEMKEAQDMEMEVLRIRNKELSDKVEVLDKRLSESGSNLEGDGASRTETEVSSEKTKPSNRQKRSTKNDEDFESLCKQYKDEIDNLKAEIDDLKDEMETLAAENEQLQHILEEQKMTISSLESKRTANESESVQTTHDLNKTISDLQLMLQKSREEYDLLRKQYEQSLMDANDQVSIMRENADIFKDEAFEKTNKLEMEITDLRQQIEASETNAKELEKNLQEALQEKGNLEEKLASATSSLEKQISSVNTSMAEVTELLNIRIQEVSDLRQELQRQYVDHEEAKVKLQDSIQELSRDLNEKKQQVESLKKSLSVKENEFIQQQSVETVSAVVSQATQELMQKHAIEIEEKEKEVRQLNEKVFTLEATMNEHSVEKQNHLTRLDAQQQELELLKQSLAEKESIIESLQVNVTAMNEQLTRKESETSQHEERVQRLSIDNQGHVETIGELQKTIQEYVSRIQNLEQELETVRTALTEKESALERCDQESTKCKTSMEDNNVEVELSTKCGEIDALEKELLEKTEQINSLNTELDKTRTVLEETRRTLNEKEMELDRVSSERHSSNIVDGLPIFRMGDDNHNLQHIIDNMQVELERKQEEIEHFKYILSENTYPSILQEMQDRINCLYNERNELEASLEAAMLGTEEKTKQIDSLKQQIETQNPEFVSKEEANLLSKERRSVQDQEGIVRFQNELHAKEQEINDLKYVIAEKDSQLSLQASMEPQSDDFELREMVQRLTAELYGREQEIQHLRSAIFELQTEVSRLQEFEKLSEETREAIQKLNLEKEQVRLEAQEFLETKLKEKEMEIDEIKQKLSAENRKILDEVQLRDRDIENLMKQLEESSVAQQRTNQVLHDKEEELLRANTDLEEKDRRLAELSITKDAELHNLRVQIHDKEVRIEELLALSDEEEKQLIELKNILEAREMEINTLKKLLEDKVKEYELIQSVLKKDVPVVDTFAAQDSEASGEKGNTSMSQELDIALYMLHQRDIRCEELTHELMQLLEERDTLQLRLSDAIRVNEELRKKSGSDSSPKKDATTSENMEPLVEHPSPSKSEGPVEIAKEAIDAPVGEDKEALALKLSQLHTVSHAKDVRLRDERELRHTQQMSLLAHKDVLSTLPPEAAARLVNANYTLSRDVQSQSSVLLNWLWGKSTPKVVHM